MVISLICRSRTTSIFVEDELATTVAGLVGCAAVNPAPTLTSCLHGTLKAEWLWEIKAGQLRKSGLVSIHRGS